MSPNFFWESKTSPAELQVQNKCTRNVELPLFFLIKIIFTLNYIFKLIIYTDSCRPCTNRFIHKLSSNKQPNAANQ